jgi:hypothetical protein
VKRRGIELRPYQLKPFCTIARAVGEGRGGTFTVEIARQGGKNELSAHLERFVLLGASAPGGDIIKTAPTYRPQLRISMHRLWSRLHDGSGALARRQDNEISVGAARVLFLSAEPNANVVGHTASLLLEVDEAQDIDQDKFDRDFRPMAATTNATCVMYGTAWDERALLERQIQANLESERRGGERRHYAYDWEIVAKYNPTYGRYVEAERERLGETHPLFLTQYCLKAIAGGGRLFSASQLAQLAGAHERIAQPRAGEAYVAGLDLAGGTSPPGPLSVDGEGERRPGDGAHDATVLTIGRLRYDDALPWTAEPRVEIVEHAARTGEPHETLLPRLIDLLRNVWRAVQVCVDATGLGETVARLLGAALGESRVEGVKFSAESKSRLGFALVAAVNGGRLKAYRGDGSPEHREFWRQCERARAAYRANRTMNFFVDRADGHDDYLMSAALLVHASRGRVRRVATGRVRD